jgi:D-alanyl-D-alanine endopeptidase (penicillin-binding protein 7)
MDATLNWFWQGGLVAIASFVMLRALAGARANVRYLVCWAAALLVVALPVLSRLHAAAIPAAAGAPLESAAILSLPAVWWTSGVLMLTAWAMWAVFHAVRFAAAIRGVRRARAGSHPFPADVESALPHWGRLRATGRGATLVVSDAVATAAVLGWGSPVIAVAPSMVALLDPDELDRILIHEWAHVQRRDDLICIPQVLVRAIAGWHPALWWIDRRLHVEREIACDETTVAIAGSPKSYAACLLKLATLRGRPRVMRMAPAALTASCLRARVCQIVTPRKSMAPAWSRSLAAAMVTLLAVMSMGVGGLTVVAIAFATPSAPPTAAARLTALMPAARPVPASSLAPSQSPASPSRPASSAAASAPEASVAAPRPRIEPPPAAAPDTTSAVEPIPAATVLAARVRAITAPLPGTPRPAPAKPAIAADTSATPWAAAAAGGSAIGRKSRDAGVATAGFFTRVARRVGGSF